MYSIYRFRQLGLSVRAFEAAADVGGTWWWNRYPGARCDIQSIDYSYSFDEQLEQEWTWSERYATQPEILSYANHVADRFDLRRDVQFETRVTSATWSDDDQSWTVTTDRGQTLTARYLVMAVGCLSTKKLPEIDGLDSFVGTVVHTGQWPHEPVDVLGKRVGVIGTGSSAIQLIPILAQSAAHLTVFQRTPAFTFPAKNAPLDDEQLRAMKQNYPAHRAAARQSFGGVVVPPATSSALDADEAERQQRYEQAWEGGTLHGLLAAYNDLMVDERANETAAEFVRQQIAAIVDDPQVAERLAPRSYPIGSKRACLDTNYYATYNRDNVTLIDLRETPLDVITEGGVRTADGTVHELDVLVLATGFDAITGPLLEPLITGRDGLTLRQAWADGPHTYLGLTVAGFPNMFTITGPGSPSVMTNMMVSIEQHVEWIAQCIADLGAAEQTSIEATVDAQNEWSALVTMIAEHTLYPRANSWYTGANVPGKPRGFMLYLGGVGNYRNTCAEVAAEGYRGFTRR